MTLPAIDIITDDPRWNALDFDVEGIAIKAVTGACEQAKIPSLLSDITEMELSVLLTSDSAVQTMNRDFRGIDKPTNVLSFAAIDKPTNVLSFAAIDDPDNAPGPEPFHLGDLAFALETLQRESAEQDKSLQNHFAHLVVHGVLHLLGYDHEENDEAEAMEALEIKILGGLGVENPYNTLHFMPD